MSSDPHQYYDYHHHHQYQYHKETMDPLNNYILGKEIGRGSYASVFLATEKSTQTRYVMKRIDMRQLSQKDISSCKQEVDLLRKLNHPFIVNYKESFVDNKSKTLNIVMVYCDGGDLASRIKAANGKLFSEDQILSWFTQIALGMHYIHSLKILHRDLKSQNIFLTRSNSTGAWICQIGDFGIAKVLNATLAMAATAIGTPLYMSPEICQNKPYSFKSDVWSLGCVLYELCTLRHAFDAQNLNGLVMKIIRGTYPPISSSYSQKLSSLVSKMLNKTPSQRPSLDQVLKLPMLRKYIPSSLTGLHSQLDILGIDINSDVPAAMPVQPPPAAALQPAHPLPQPLVQAQQPQPHSYPYPYPYPPSGAAARPVSQYQPSQPHHPPTNMPPAVLLQKREEAKRALEELNREKQRQKDVADALARMKREREARMKEREDQMERKRLLMKQERDRLTEVELKAREKQKKAEQNRLLMQQQRRVPVLNSAQAAAVAQQTPSSAPPSARQGSAGSAAGGAAVPFAVRQPSPSGAAAGGAPPPSGRRPSPTASSGTPAAAAAAVVAIGPSSSSVGAVSGALHTMDRQMIADVRNLGKFNRPASHPSSSGMTGGDDNDNDDDTSSDEESAVGRTPRHGLAARSIPAMPLLSAQQQQQQQQQGLRLPQPALVARHPDMPPRPVSQISAASPQPQQLDRRKPARPITGAPLIAGVNSGNSSSLAYQQQQQQHQQHHHQKWREMQSELDRIAPNYPGAAASSSSSAKPPVPAVPAVSPFDGLSAKDRVLLQKQMRKQQEEDERKAQIAQAQKEYFEQRKAADSRTRMEYEGSNAVPVGPSSSRGPSPLPSVPVQVSLVQNDFQLEDDDDGDNCVHMQGDDADEAEEHLEREESVLKSELAERTLRIEELRRSLHAAHSILGNDPNLPIGDLEDDDHAQRSSALRAPDEEEDGEIVFSTHGSEEDLFEQQEDGNGQHGHVTDADGDDDDECVSPPSDDDNDAAEEHPGRVRSNTEGSARAFPQRQPPPHDSSATPSSSAAGAGGARRGGLMDRQRLLREQCTRALGPVPFGRAYEIIKQSHQQPSVQPKAGGSGTAGNYAGDDGDNGDGLGNERAVRIALEEVLGLDKLQYWPLIDQLVFIENLL